MTDGLQGLEQYPITDVTIAGIGGEVITDILKQAAFLKKPGIRLILQPQSREHILRSFLFENGFPIFHEQALRSGRYTYVVLLQNIPERAESSPCWKVIAACCRNSTLLNQKKNCCVPPDL